jgi:serine/threonine protein kinase/Flp pilus assembly protein TadD
MSRVALTDRSNRPCDSPSSVLAELIDQVTARLQAGEAIDWNSLLRDHPEHADELRRLRPALDVLDELSRSGSSAAAVPAEDAGGVPGALGDFRVLREVGRGGMGVVYEAEQVSLRRRVALKVLPLAATMDSRQLARFHNEARAAAGLHHTNIVPVYAVGTERGTHYYAMQFIDGQDLASLVAQLREQAGRRPPEPEAETRTIARLSTERGARPREHYRTVARLGIQAAEGLDHAHQMGIVHRDVKPANLLVEADRLWITDFGLAQIQSDTRLTMTGDLLGTLRYMSPEQALAQRAIVDHRTDVYSLGATLYELLTLEPAFPARDRQELLRQIAFEEPAAPRRLDRNVPAELETIVLKAMEKGPEHRYGTAQELADDLERFLRDEPIRARRPSLRQRLGKWGWRHRTAVTAATACLVVTVAALVGSIGWALGDQRARQRQAEARVIESLEEAAPVLRQGNPQHPALIAAVQRAKAQVGAGAVGPELRECVEQLLRDWEMLARLETARLQRAAGAKETDWDYAGTDELYAEAFKKYNLDVTALGAQEAAQRIRTSAIRAHLVAALDDWAHVQDRAKQGKNRALLLDVADSADECPWARQMRRAVRHGDGAALERLAREPALPLAPANLERLARPLLWAGKGAAAEELLRRAQREQPADFWVNFALADAFDQRRPPDRAQAVRFAQAALVLRPQSPAAHNNLGVYLVKQGRLVEAEEAFRKAIALKAHPLHSSNLTVALMRQGRLEEAEAACRAALRLAPHFVLAHDNLGAVLERQGKYAEAERAYRKAIALKPDLASAHSNLANALREQGKLAEAVKECGKAIRLQPDYAPGHCVLGDVLREQGKLAEAEAAYRKALGLGPDLAEAHWGLGAALQEQGKQAEAEAACRRALRLKPDFAGAHSTLGNALVEQGKPKEAEGACRQAIRLKPRVATYHNNLGRALLAQRKLKEAEEAFRKAIRLQPEYAVAHNNLGAAQAAQGKLTEAEKDYRKAIDLKPDLAVAHRNLGWVLKGQGKLTEAERAFRKANALERARTKGPTPGKKEKPDKP